MWPGTATRLERGLALGQSIFEQYPHVIVSLNFIKSDRRRDDFLRTCPELVVVDEAHTCAQPSGVNAGRSAQHLAPPTRRWPGLRPEPAPGEYSTDPICVS